MLCQHNSSKAARSKSFSAAEIIQGGGYVFGMFQIVFKLGFHVCQK